MISHSWYIDTVLFDHHYLIKIGITESSVVLLPEIEDVFSPILWMTLARCIFSLVNEMTYWFVTCPS